MTNYVVGFLFDDVMSKVTLIKKNRPEWQAGLLNGVGGKIEPTDIDSHHAMAREFKEETGVDILPLEWRRFAILLNSPQWTLNVFCAEDTIAQSQVKTVTDEEIVTLSVKEILEIPYLRYVQPPLATIPNIPWLISMAIMEPDKEFLITAATEAV